MEPLLLDQSPQGINLKSNLTNRNGILADQNAPLLSVDIASVESSSIAGIVNNMGEKSGDAAGNSDGSLMNHAIMNTAQQLPYSLGSMEGLKENAPFRPGQGGFINDAALKHHEGGRGALNSLSQGTLWPETEKISTGENEVNAAENRNIGNNVIVTIEKESPKRGDSEIVCIDSVEPTSLLNSSNQTNVGERKGAEVGESRKLEILKSIVYGGLIESITSLGVVSSAAGASAGTLNIIALGLANLIGGLFIIGHNLMDLKNDHSDRYQETLGRRDNFSLHAALSILSFLIFGLLPPVMYGFSFRKSDDRDLKLAAVGGASLFCIILLAIGKAHTQRKQPKPYISTIFYFFCTGLMASGCFLFSWGPHQQAFAENKWVRV
ncbi:MEMBRANE PROTEIN OF ER BODY-LIKE PROTEIN [Salix koriyanagi]|uniref:MEMBRANE PROTEIN OF ER BODY-LIKE PROTEIN n=1 Tax=Salix koriyanagi TaxID=2511006 RepID=A0A9Q0WC94_9ROSI|nr:MEMBRANE PROTEIN OF ER BODY-LIKE PROTEIN [Salix koriyanagi]